MTALWTRGKWSGVASPYRFRLPKQGGWHICYGVSGLLVAEGSGWSLPVGKALLRKLEADHHKRRPKRMPLPTPSV